MDPVRVRCVAWARARKREAAEAAAAAADLDRELDELLDSEADKNDGGEGRYWLNSYR